MATVRIFLPTYRRAQLLPRALASLQAQTFTDWVCEVHNDDPADAEPGRLVAALGDQRFTFVQHPRNLGGTATFNLFFHAAAEPFYSMLEDDNWWEPDFLATLLAAADRHPGAVVFWANQKIWDELPDGGWRDTGRTTWPAEDASRTFAWGQPAQSGGALHAHGAALFRSRAGDDFATPDVPIAVTEPFRERALPHPLVLVARPVANFAATLQTARSRDAAEWAELQAMLTATFFRGCPWPRERVAEFWAQARAQHPPATSNLIAAALADPAGGVALEHARARDWWVVLRGFLRRPGLYFRLRRSRTAHPGWWQYLETHTARRWAEGNRP
jgi:hypothetical protein